MKINSKSLDGILTGGGIVGISVGIGLGLCWLVDKFYKEGDSSDAPTPNPQGLEVLTAEGDSGECCQSDYDAEGFHKNGYNRAGYNRDGYDFEGFNRHKYNANGKDRAGYDTQYYNNRLSALYKLKEEAFLQMNAGEYVYALLDVRLVLEEITSLLIAHSLGTGALRDTLLQNMRVCEAHNLYGYDPELVNRLHGVRKICNPRLHTLSDETQISINQVYFAVAQVRDLIPFARQALSC